MSIYESESEEALVKWFVGVVKARPDIDYCDFSELERDLFNKLVAAYNRWLDDE